MQYVSKHISVPIPLPVDVVYARASDPANPPRWAPGLVTGGIRRLDDERVAESAVGTIRIPFADPTAHGVLDHLVTLADGEAQLKPMRAVPNCDGAEHEENSRAC